MNFSKLKLATIIIICVFSSNSYSIESEVCQNLAEKFGRQFKIPNKLLSSISIVESGTVKENKLISWPWTLNVDGEAKYFKTKEETVNFLESNLKKFKNIDVGCMQISTKYHLQKFNNVSELINPENNVKYAAKYLRKLFHTHKTWNEAISRYHSSIPSRKKNYLSKVHYFWKKLRETRTPETTKKKLDFFKSQLRKDYQIL